MPENRKKPTFSVQDEIRRDRRIRRANRMRKARTRARVLLTVLLCTVIFALLVAAVGITVLRVKTTAVIGNERYSAEEILEAAELDGEILLLIGNKTVYKRISEKCPYVDKIELVKEYPSTVTVKVTETEAKYALNVFGRTLTLDAALRVMDYTDSVDGLISLSLPEIKSAVEGKRIVFASEEGEKFTEGMLKAFFEDGKADFLTSLDISERFSLSGAIMGEAEIAFGDYKNIPEKLTVVKQLLNDAKDEYAKFARIDVSVLSQASLKLEY